MLLLGNKTDNEKEREVPNGMGEHLAMDYNLIFYECSACSGHNTKKSMLHLARILKEHEDKVKESGCSRRCRDAAAVAVALPGPGAGPLAARPPAGELYAGKMLSVWCGWEPGPGLHQQQEVCSK